MKLLDVPKHPLRHAFSGFLLRRKRQSHFRRHPLVSALTEHSRGVLSTIPTMSSGLLQVSHDEPEQAIVRLKSHPNGLTSGEAVTRLHLNGPNEVAQERPLSVWMQLWLCYRDPFNLLLSLLAAVSYASGDMKATTVIASMVGLSSVLRFVQDRRSHRAAESLRAMVSNTTRVVRQPAEGYAHPGSPILQAIEIPMRDVVQGDLVQLSAGDMVPADCRVLTACDLFIAQAAMTGEALPVEKFVQRQNQHESPLEQTNLVFMGTNVVSGSAKVLVVATGERTYFGALAVTATATDTTPNAFQAGVNSVSWLLIRFALVMVPVVLLVNGFTKGDWAEAALFALSVAVGLTPEMLPMIVTSTLAKGAVLLSRKQVVVKRLDAIQNFGAMDVLCTDKTGTLTQDKIALARKIDPFGAPCEAVLHLACLNSHHQTGLKNLLDRAVLASLDTNTERQLEQHYCKIDELPFDFQRRRMSVIVRHCDETPLLICKGAVEEVLDVCTRMRLTDDLSSDAQGLDAVSRSRAILVAQHLARDGMRVVAVACKTVPMARQHYTTADESELTLVGFIAFLDPPKDSAAPALRALTAHGIQVKVLTGDNETVTVCVCAQVGLPSSEVLLGPQVEAMDDFQLALAVEQHQVFAKLAPMHKERIVRALRRNGHVVGFIGDGINDAPALRSADIGISVDSAVDIAKEAADIILLEKSLLVLDEGVIEGRKTFSNMLKYIRMTASSNFGNVLSVLVASAFLPFLPMLPLHLLVQNLLYDIGQTGIPFDNVDAQLVSLPLKWNPNDIGRFMVFFGPISSVFDITTFALMWWVFGAQTLARQSLFQSGWFVVGLLTQTLVVHMLRTPLLPFVQSRAAPALLLLTTFIMALGIFLPMGPLAGYFKLQPLPLSYFAWLVGILLGYGFLTTLMKNWYIRKFGWQ